MTREIDMLVPELQKKYWEWDALMKESKIPYVITCTGRYIHEQIALYAQGRTPLSFVNTIRAKLGWTALAEKDNREVTWTLNSKHIIYPPTIMQAFAFDFVITQNGKAVWDVKCNVNANDIPDYLEAGELAESIGLKWGGRFSKKDFVHIELPT